MESVHEVFKIKKILIFIIIPLLSTSQEEKLQSIGSSVTYIISCPCKLFKYYENGDVFYFCKDDESNIEYRIRETRHKDGLDRFLSSLDQNLYRNQRNSSKVIMASKKQAVLKDYLMKNPNGVDTKFLNSEAIIVSEPNVKKLFFSDEDFVASFEIIVSGNNKNILNTCFNQSINSLLPKRKNLKKIF